MRKRLMLISAANWQSLFLYQLRRFRNRNLYFTFQTFFTRKRGLAHSYLLHEHESLQNSL